MFFKIIHFSHDILFSIILVGDLILRGKGRKTPPRPTSRHRVRRVVSWAVSVHGGLRVEHACQ